MCSIFRDTACQGLYPGKQELHRYCYLSLKKTQTELHLLCTIHWIVRNFHVHLWLQTELPVSVEDKWWSISVFTLQAHLADWWSCPTPGCCRAAESEGLLQGLPEPPRQKKGAGCLWRIILSCNSLKYLLKPLGCFRPHFHQENSLKNCGIWQWDPIKCPGSAP